MKKYYMLYIFFIMFSYMDFFQFQSTNFFLIKNLYFLNSLEMNYSLQKIKV